jgi:hypothetical protein
MRVLVNVGLILIMVFGISLTIQAQQKEMKKEVLSWEDAKEAYHHAMSSTFHPAEEGDFKPLKEGYNDLAVSAKNWMAVDIPESLDGKELKPRLKKLYKESSKIGKLIEKGVSDEELKGAIFGLHDVFHEIVGLCQEH